MLVIWELCGACSNHVPSTEYKTNFYIGDYLIAEESAKAYDNKAKELYGEFARLNF